VAFELEEQNLVHMSILSLVPQNITFDLFSVGYLLNNYSITTWSRNDLNALECPNSFFIV